MIVTVESASGLTNAYRSVESATGSLEISGASRWEDMAHSPRWVCRGNGSRSRAGGAAGGSAGGAQDVRSELLVAEADLAGSDEDADLAGAGVPHVGHDGLVAAGRRPAAGGRPR